MQEVNAVDGISKVQLTMATTLWSVALLRSDPRRDLLAAP